MSRLSPSRPRPAAGSRLLRRLLLIVVAAATLGCAGTRGLRAQDAPSGERARGQFAGMQRLAGEVTAVSADTVTVKTEDGTTARIVTTPNTRMMKGQGVAIKVADLKAGDGVMAAGVLDAPAHTLHAAIVFATDAEQVRKLREGLGKVYIAGKVTAIDLDNARLTVLRPDNVSQTITVDDSTSFRRGRGARMNFGTSGIGGVGFGGANPPGADAPGAATRSAPGGNANAPTTGGESITLADIKVGDQVAGQGAVKNGVFVPTQLNVNTPGQRQRRNAAADAPQ